MWRFVALLFLIYILLSKHPEPNEKYEHKLAPIPISNCSCENHNFCYADPLNPSIFYKKFDCSSLKILREFGILEEEDTKKTTRDSKNVIFVSATSNDHFEFTKKSLESIRKYYPNQKYILYTMGLDQSNSEKLLEDFENLEIRQFNFSKYPKYVENLMEYRWKPLIIGELLREYSNIWWMDAHIILESSEHLDRIYEERARGDSLQSDIIFTIPTKHSNFAVLHPNLLEYFPTSSIALLKRSVQLGANFIYFARSRDSLDILKWWILCALDEKCMNPEGAQLKCQFAPLNHYDVYAKCFRFDQSVLNLLLLNRFQDYRKYLSSNGFGESHY